MYYSHNGGKESGENKNTNTSENDQTVAENIERM